MLQTVLQRTTTFFVGTQVRKIVTGVTGALLLVVITFIAGRDSVTKKEQLLGVYSTIPSAILTTTPTVTVTPASTSISTTTPTSIPPASVKGARTEQLVTKTYHPTSTPTPIPVTPISTSVLTPTNKQTETPTLPTQIPAPGTTSIPTPPTNTPILPTNVTISQASISTPSPTSIPPLSPTSSPTLILPTPTPDVLDKGTQNALGNIFQNMCYIQQQLTINQDALNAAIERRSACRSEYENNTDLDPFTREELIRQCRATEQQYIDQYEQQIAQLRDEYNWYAIQKNQILVGCPKCAEFWEQMRKIAKENPARYGCLPN